MDLIGIGGANIDRIGRTTGPHIAGTSNPGSLRESVGGGVFNALRVAALRAQETGQTSSQQKTSALGIISARGADTAGSKIEQAIREAGIADFSFVSANSSTATYTAILDQSGELITALADMAIYGEALPGHLNEPSILSAIADSKAVLIDANIAETEVKTVCNAARRPVFAIAISASKIARLLTSARGIDVLFMNHHEARQISGQEDSHLAAQHCIETLGFQKIIITQGKNPVLVVQAGQFCSVEVPKAETTDLVDVTGAGDALCGGTIAALLRDPNLPLPQAVREGIACSVLTLSTSGPLCPAIATHAFTDALAKVSPPTPLPTRNA